MALTQHTDLIPESTIVIFSPHFDDVLFMLGGYINELKKQSLMQTKNFHVIIIFSRSNYLAGTGEGNFDSSPDRIKLATGKRLLEDQDCNDELFGRFTYTYELLGENECFTRGKSFADSEMEFPHGMYADFDEEDHAIFERMKARIEAWSEIDDTALVFPTAIKEHIDHFITREAAIEVAKEDKHSATFYFQEDKPYGGIADAEELSRLDSFVTANKLRGRTYTCDPESVIQLAFKHYVSQVEEVYKTGIRRRAQTLQQEINAPQPCDRIYVYPS
ncbi:MAG: hypothetical protein JNK79_07050 [Chitinophagaceae bacterium]|nr:hypothetical protein [Chitinophagaceae bacterium]